jgi:hypothetical protein
VWLGAWVLLIIVAAQKEDKQTLSRVLFDAHRLTPTKQQYAQG